MRITGACGHDEYRTGQQLVSHPAFPTRGASEQQMDGKQKRIDPRRIMKVNLRSLALAVCLLTSAAVAGLSGCAGTQSKQSTGEYIDDKATNSRVKKALGEDVEYKFEHVNVDTFKGTVQLNGFVNTRAQKNKAADIAKTVPGVKEIVNNITIRE